MAITPGTTVRLCNVPFDNTYKNQIYFPFLNTQTTYFMEKTQKTFSDYSYVRKEVDGKVHEGIRVSAHIDTLAICNYVMYQNSNYTNKWFYAFITEMVYKNDSCTEIYFETDAYQTWRFEVNLLSSYVIREHSVTDEIGDNVIPESFSFKDYELVDITSHFSVPSLTTWGYLVATTEQKGADGSRGKAMSGIYQGLYFYYFTDTLKMNDFLDAIDEEGGDCVQFICAIPEFCVSGNTVGENGWLYYSDTPANVTLSYDKPPYINAIDLYYPKNKKCYTEQFYNIMVSNNAGESKEFAIENWVGDQVKFKMYGDISASPSVVLVPVNYKSLEEDFENALSLAGFPQCAFNSDTFKLWLSRNQFALGVNAVTGVAQVAGGVATGNVGTAVNGATGIVNLMADISAHSKDANKAHVGSTKANLLTACKRNKFSVYIKYLKKDYIRMVDEFFTMFGYATNRVKVPNVSSRPYYNYVQTMDVNITGAIPNNDLRTIKAMYNNGVTFWKHTATVGNYSVDNSPS